MPELSRFYGIVVRMFYDDHPPPHLHAYYGEHSATIDIERAMIINGSLPPRAIRLVIEWTLLHQGELRDRWNKSQDYQKLEKIDPLP